MKRDRKYLKKLRQQHGSMPKREFKTRHYSKEFWQAISMSLRFFVNGPKFWFVAIKMLFRAAGRLAAILLSLVGIIID